jgi:hypothetical protein
MGRHSVGTITLSNHGVGRVSVDPATVRGEGEAHDARLVVPVEMSSQPEERQLALTRLAGTLHFDQPDIPGCRVGLPDSADLTYNMPCRSLPDGSMPHVVELRFPLGLSLIEKIEWHRHANDDCEAVLLLHLEATVVWLHTTHGSPPMAATPHAEAGRDAAARFALHSEMSTFWLPRVDHLRIAIDQAQWIRNVLPGVGYDRVRLVEFTLPPSLPDVARADAGFGQLLYAFDSGQYDDAVAASRGILAAWRSYIGATKQSPVASTVADRLQWPATDPRRALLDQLWKTMTDLANVPHHPEGQTEAFEPTAADARLQLMLAIILSDYLGDVLHVDTHST